MTRTHLARTIVATTLLLSIARAATPLVASATALPSGASVQSSQGPQEPMVEPFTPPGAPGETAPVTGTAAVESREPVEGAPGETGVETQVPPEDAED